MSRHKIAGKKLNRNTSSREALFRALCCALLSKESIKTTLAKAKALRPVVEKLITLSAQDSLAARRKLFSVLRDKTVVEKLIKVIGPKFAKRPGGYTRVVRCGFRNGDSAPMAIIQLIPDVQETV